MNTARELLEHALALAGLGWDMVPLYGIVGGNCTCSARAACSSPGKHPRFQRWQEQATTDRTTIRAWLDKWPTANLGLTTGARSGVFVLDIDPRHGGDVALAALEARHGRLPETVEQLTGGGGRHLVFQHPGWPVGNRAGLTEGIDVRGDGGFVVVAPSRHASGRAYAWEASSRPGEVPVAAAPDWLLALLRDATRQAAPPVADVIQAGQRNDRLTSIAGTMRRRGLSEDGIFAALLVENNLRCHPPLDEAEVRTIAASVARYAPRVSPAAGDSRPDVRGTPGAADAVPPTDHHGAGSPDQGHPTLTDAGNAIRFARQHGEDVRYCWAWKAWFIWDGQRWARDEGDGVVALAKKTAHSIYHEAAQEPDTDRRRAIATWWIKSQSEPAIQHMLELAKSEPGIPVTPKELDSDPFLLNTSSGTLETRTLHLRPHRRADLITKITGAPYIAGARHPVFDAYLARVLPNTEVRSFVQWAAGYSLTGSTAEEVLFFAHGPGASGKSTMLRALRTALGDYATTADFTSFTERRADGPKEDIARLAGARLVVSVEVKDGTRLAEGLIKWLTGGDDIAARRLYEKTFEFTPQFKLWLAANNRPRVRDDDEAFWRRVKEIPFTEPIPESERDPSVKVTLCDPAQGGPAILAWAVEGAAAYFREGLAVPDPVRAATAAYREEMDPMAPFLEAMCALDKGSSISAGALRTAYETWAKEQGIRHPLGGKAWGDRLRARGCKPGKEGGERLWVGIRLRGAMDPDQEPDQRNEGTPGGQSGRVGQVGQAGPQLPLYARARDEFAGCLSNPSNLSSAHSMPRPADPDNAHVTGQSDWRRRSDAETILALLRKAGARVTATGWTLLIEPEGIFPEALLAEARVHEGEILRLLMTDPTIDPDDPANDLEPAP